MGWVSAGGVGVRIKRAVQGSGRGQSDSSMQATGEFKTIAQAF